MCIYIYRSYIYRSLHIAYCRLLDTSRCVYYIYTSSHIRTTPLAFGVLLNSFWVPGHQHDYKSGTLAGHGHPQIDLRIKCWWVKSTSGEVHRG